MDWDANAPRWRHFVRLEENPWIRHHVVSKKTLSNSDLSS
jgi:hypothetical protein